MLLIVLLMLLMATGSALYAMQATFFEQGAATSYGEAAWTRSLAEGAAMSGLAVVHETGQTINRGIQRASIDEQLDVRWRDQGTPRAMFSTKYAVPTPLDGTTPLPTNADDSHSFDNLGDNNVFIGTMPQGLTDFCTPPRDGQAPYGAPFAMRNVRVSSCRVLYEIWLAGGNGPTSTNPSGRARFVITGIGETTVPGEVADAVGHSSGQRGLHETVGMARAYIDI